MDKNRRFSKSAILDDLAATVGRGRLLTVVAIKLLARLEVRASTIVPTAGINGRELVLNPAWVSSLSEDEWVGLIMHEACHLILKHSTRGRGRSRALWNVAADIEINELLCRAGFKLPAGGQNAAAYNFPRELTAEEYYELLLKEKNTESSGGANQDGDQTGDSSPHGDADSTGSTGQSAPQRGMDVHGRCVHEDNPVLGEEDDTSAIEGTIEEIVRELRAGSSSSSLQRILDRVARATRVSWQEILRKYLRSATEGRERRTYIRPSARAMVCAPICRPTVLRQATTVLVLVDQSGSMDDDTVARALAEVEKIAAVANVWYSAVDTEATPPVRVRKELPKRRDLCGGTDFAKGFELIKQVRADVLVVLTDGLVDEWPADPRIPVIVVLFGSWADEESLPKYRQLTVIRTGEES